VQLVSKISNLCDPDPPTLQTDRQTDGQTDRRTDGRTTCNLNTALCTSASRGTKGARFLKHSVEPHVKQIIINHMREANLGYYPAWPKRAHRAPPPFPGCKILLTLHHLLHKRYLKHQIAPVLAIKPPPKQFSSRRLDYARTPTVATLLRHAPIFITES